MHIWKGMLKMRGLYIVMSQIEKHRSSFQRLLQTIHFSNMCVESIYMKRCYIDCWKGLCDFTILELPVPLNLELKLV